jgi:hypothetical protein
MKMVYRALLLALVAFSGILAHAGTVKPDSEKGDLSIEFEFKKMAALVPILATPLNDGNPIKNADGKQVVKGETTSFVGKAKIVFRIITNDLKVNGIVHAHGKPGQKLDPGYSYDSVFDSSGIMTTDPLTTWLENNGYTESNGIVVTDFLGAVLDDIYYGVNFATLLDNGASFSSSHAMGDQFAIDASGQHIAALPQYLFSATPINYVVGQGWVGTPLPVGTLLEYSGDHVVDSSPVPEPGCIGLFTSGVVYLLVTRPSRDRFRKIRWTAA